MYFCMVAFYSILVLRCCHCTVGQGSAKMRLFKLNYNFWLIVLFLTTFKNNFQISFGTIKLYFIDKNTWKLVQSRNLPIVRYTIDCLLFSLLVFKLPLYDQGVYSYLFIYFVLLYEVLAERYRLRPVVFWKIVYINMTITTCIK